MKRELRFVVMLAMLGAAMLGAGRAQATCCLSDADCPAGFACFDGACNPSITDCTCDADCGPGLHCQATGVTLCFQAPGGTQQCHLHNQCLAAWQGICATDADCGPGGFTCTVNGTVCDATGCQATTMCRDPILPATCLTDADCPAAWTCEADTDVSTSCIPEVMSCPAQGCPAPTGAKVCRPPLFALVGGSRFIGVPAPSLGCAGAGGKSPGDSAGGGGGAGMGGGQVAAGGGPGSAGPGTRPLGNGCQLGLGPAASRSAPLPLLLALWALAIRRATRRR